MMALEQAREYLEQLGLTEAASSAALDRQPSGSSPTQRWSDLLGGRRSAGRYAALRLPSTLSPYRLEEFDFGFQGQVRELASLTFVSQAANLVLLGPPGVGKTHLAVALGLEAISRGCRPSPRCATHRRRHFARPGACGHII